MTTTKRQPDTGKVYSVTEAAKVFGVHRNTVHSWINRGDLKSFKKGSRRFIRAQDLLPRDSEMAR